ncbi:hypothetical protein LCGC14_1615950 [marine sediment metagenome]|uniref:Cytochrome c-type biogenesis protein CcmE n=1 Tax=marine sediment metagenome TaxID=412755 RepID=A0A0F9I6W8_9ZZZZ
MKKKKVKFIIGGIIIAVAIIYLVYSGIQKTGLYYLTVSEIKNEGSIAYGQSTRVNGNVLDGSIQWDSQEGTLRFIISDGENDLPIIYRGVVPDTFRGGAEVVVEGIYTPENIFEADKIMAKCPSKYEAQENEE